MAKRMLADVLWEAANVHLSAICSEGRRAYTCYAAGFASGLKDDRYFGPHWEDVRNTAAVRFLGSLGCKPDSLESFSMFPEGEVRQGVRYMWLLLAMHVAEDEGIELEAA